MKNNLTKIFITLFLIVILVWVIFYTVISGQIYEDAEINVGLAAEQIMDNLSAELAELERVSFLLSQREKLLEITKESNAAAYYLLAGNAESIITNSRINQGFVGNIIIYNDLGLYYRFSGKLSNTSCSRLGYLIQEMDLPGHISLELEYQNYIGYISGIYDHAGECTGFLAMLVEEEKILELIRQSALGDTLYVAVTARGETVTSNLNMPDDPVFISTRHVGLTPFEIIVAADKSALSASTYYFAIAAIATAVIFGLLIFTFIRQINKRFLSPIIKVMDYVEALDWTAADSHLLPAIQNEVFDGLVSKINNMLIRLEEQSGEIQAADLRAKNAELQKQKAIIFSLKKQINAHFVINTLNTIKILIEQNNMLQAQVVTNDLSSMIRYAYEKEDSISIWQELQMLEQYITIMNARYASKIDTVFDVDDRLMDVWIPRMLLQPIVENAIVHGFKKKHEDCEIKITAEKTRDFIRISIQDNGIGMSKEKLEDITQRLASNEKELPDGIDNIALINIKQQLNAYYGNDARIEIHSDPDKGTKVTLTVLLALIG